MYPELSAPGTSTLSLRCRVLHHIVSTVCLRRYQAVRIRVPTFRRMSLVPSSTRTVRDETSSSLWSYPRLKDGTGGTRMSTAIFEAADWVRVSVPKYRIWGVRRCIDDLKVGNAAETAILRLDGSMS